MKITKNGGGFESLDHEIHPPGASGDTRLLTVSADVNPHLWFGMNHHLDRDQVKQVVKHLRQWLHTGQLSLETTDERLKAAGHTLYEHLGGSEAQGRNGWLQAVGVGDGLFVYTQKRNTPKIPKTWEGFEVETCYAGRIRPARK